MKDSDAVLLQRWITDRDAEAFCEILIRYTDMVYSTCKRILNVAEDAEDVAQESFLKLVRGNIEIRTSFPGWLHAVARRCALDRLRSDQRRKLLEREYSRKETSSTNLNWEAIKGYVDEAIEALPEDLRYPIIQHFLTGESQESIAQTLGITRSAVNHRIRKGIERARKHLKRRGLPIPIAVLAAMLTDRAIEAAPVSLKAALGKLAISGVAIPGGISVAHTSVLGGFLLMKKVAISAAAILVLLSGLWIATKDRLAGELSPQAAMSKPPLLDGQKSRPRTTDAETAREENMQTAPRTPTAASKWIGLFGTVRNQEGRPLAQICVRWVPVEPAELAKVRHDGAVMGETGDVTKLPVGRVRDAFAQSRFTMSNERGRYELEIPTTDPRGAIAASGSGYETIVQVVPDRSGERFPEESMDAPRDKQKIEINFELDFAGAISGIVTDAQTGEAARGMIVLAGLLDPDAFAAVSIVKPDSPQAVVGKSGTYSIRGIPPGSYRVVPRTGRSAYTSLSSNQGKTVSLEEGVEVTEVNFSVRRGGRIYGRCADGEGIPLADALCVALPTNLVSAFMIGNMEAVVMLGNGEQRADAAGRYEMQGLPLDQELRVMARCKGRAPTASDAVRLTEAQPEAEINLTLHGGWSISGHVCFEGGEPAPDTPVRLVPDLGAMLGGDPAAILSADTSTHTDDLGAFTLPDLPPGEYKLDAGQVNPQNMFGQQEQTKTVTLDGKGDVSGVEFIIKDGGTNELAGVVVDDLGTGIEGASVRITKAEDFMGVDGVTIQTGAKGCFSAYKLWDGPFVVMVSKKGYSDATAEGITPNTFNLELRLNRDGLVRGRIVTVDGLAPGRGGKVKARIVEGDSLFASMQQLARLGRGESDTGTPVDADGRFEVAAPVGKVMIHASVPGFAPARSEEIAVMPGEARSGIELVVSVGAVLHGTVILPDKAAVANATVTIEPAGSDASQNMLRKLLPQMFGSQGNMVLTGAEGGYEFAHLEAGTYAVSATHPDYAPSDPETVTVKQDEDRQVATLELRLAGAIVGTVREKDAPKASMMVQLIADGTMKQAMTDHDGAFRIEGLKPGEYLVNVVDISAMQRGEFAMKSRTVVLERSEEIELELVFGTGHKVYGTVKGLTGVPSREIMLRRPGGPAPEDIDPLDMKSSLRAQGFRAGVGTIRPDGAYEIVDIEPGIYILEIPKVPKDPTEMAAYAKMDRTPHFRKEITVKDGDLEVSIQVK